MKTNIARFVAFPPIVAAVSALCLLPARVPGQGSLTPPGAPAPTMKTLQQIEPRTPISALPCTISDAGSYYLTTNLTGAAGTNGITITTSDVTLDLSGFVLAGGGSSNGVCVIGPCVNLVIRNGIIRNWRMCVDAGSAAGSRFENLQVCQSTTYGLNVGTNALVVACQAQSGYYGIRAGSGSTIKSCVCRSNTATGISVSGGCTIVDSTAYANVRGINASSGCTVQSCTVSGGGNNVGILAAGGSAVIGCTIEGNQSDGVSLDRSVIKDCMIRNNTGDGIDAWINCHIVGNTCLDNGEDGIKCTYGTHAIEGNFVVGNGHGINGNGTTGNLIIHNRASYNSTNYNIAAGNSAGPIITSTTIGTNTNPHANYTF